MKSVIIILALSLLISGCTTIYQCQDGTFKNNKELCQDVCIPDCAKHFADTKTNITAIVKEKTKEIPKYILTIKRPDTYYGGFNVNPAGYSDFNNCTGLCYTSYYYGTEVEVTTVEGNGIIFTGFEGDCHGNTCNLNMTENKEVIMRYKQDLVYLTLKWEGEGSGTEEGFVSYGDMECGGTDYKCIFPILRGIETSGKPLPDENSEFDKWSGDCQGKKNCTLIMDSNKTVIMHFNKKTSTKENTGGCSYDCQINADCNTYSAKYCNINGALCDSNGMCHCTIVQDPSWKKCPCATNEICIGNYCAVQESGCPDS